MIILFSPKNGGGPTPPALPDIYVKDTELEVNRPVGCLLDWDGDYLQATAIAYAPLSFVDAETLAAAARSGEYWSRRLSKVILNGKFSTSGANAVVRVVYFDENDVEMMGPEITLTATAFQDGSDYMATMAEVITHGANKVAVEVVSVSAGTFQLRLAGV